MYQSGSLYIYGDVRSQMGSLYYFLALGKQNRQRRRMRQGADLSSAIYLCRDRGQRNAYKSRIFFEACGIFIASHCPRAKRMIPTISRMNSREKINSIGLDLEVRTSKANEPLLAPSAAAPQLVQLACDWLVPPSDEFRRLVASIRRRHDFLVISRRLKRLARRWHAPLF